MTIPNLISSFGYNSSTGVPAWRVAEHRPPFDLRTASGQEDSASSLPKARLQILVVDDEDLFREALAFKLQNIYHASVQQADTASTAVEMASEGHAFDLILMDVSLPDTGGEKAYEAMRTRGVDTPIVLMSAYEENRAVAQALGVPFLDKPLDDAALKKILLECRGEAVA